MNYQKQQQNSNNSEGTSEQQPVHKFGATDKVKRIHKKCEKYEKQQDESSEACQPMTKKKKQTAKQLKRIRQQNRRAVHKEYVANLQLQLQKKELQIQKLQVMISDLEQQLSNKVCPKCSGESTETQHVSPVVLQKINSIEVNSFQVNSIEVEPMEQKSFEIDDQFRRVHDQSSLRICFGNKNLLFFFVTMCCLTIGSIADNPEMFLEPIPPHKLKSQMCYLVNHQNLNYYSFNKQANRGHRNWHQEWDDLYCNKKNQQLKLDQNIRRVSDMLNIKQMLWKLLPKKLGSLSGLKNTVEMMLGYDGNQIMRRLLGGRNYYA